MSGNGCFTYFAYDAAGRATSIKNCLVDGTALAYFTYEYDASSRITAITRENDDTIYYGYDNADRLTSETWKDSGGSSIYAFAWDYDAVGNRTWQERNSAQTYYEHDAANAITCSQETERVNRTPLFLLPSLQELGPGGGPSFPAPKAPVGR